MSMAKVSTYRAPDAISDKRTAQLEREGQDPFDNFIIQAIGKEPFLSFSRPGDNSIQWIQLLHALEQQGTLKKGSRVDNMADENDRQQQSIASTSERNALKESGNALKGCGSSREGKNAPEKVQALKIPEAVIAFAQAAAKANGEREKYLPGWPLLSTPSKVQLQKCDKCSREFCSQINYRRHIRVHRRSLNVDKVSPKNRELLAAFWDKLSSDEAKELASFENVTFGDISGPCVLTALGSLMRKPGFSSLPHSYMKAGVTLCDLVEGRPAMFPISAEELFRLLDDASEKTFLSAGTAISLQKFVFDGGAGKIAMEMRNLIACTSFLLEQKLVKAWLADKDAEALRYQKLLFEEEEAAQKRQAELLVRKRMKKLRQKEQKMKENAVTDEAGPEDSRDAVEDASEASCPDMAADGLSLRADLSGLEDGPLSPPKLTDEIHRAEYVDGDWLLNQVAQPQESFRRQQPPSFKSTRNGFSYFHPPPAFARPAAMHRPSGYKDPKNATPFTGQKVWTRKSKPQCVDEQGVRDESAGVGGCEVLIGSISVTLKDTPDLHESQTKPLPEENPGSVGSTGHAPEETTLADSPRAAPEDEQPSRPELFSSKAVMAFLSQRWTAAVSAEHVKVSLPSEPEATAVGDAVLRGESESGTGVPDIPGAHCGQVEDMGVGMAAPAVGFRSKLGAKPERSYRLKYIPKQSITG